MNDDALYRRYRRLIVKPSLRNDATQKVFVVAFLLCVALAAGSFTFSLHLITEAGGPWWISAAGCGAGALLACLWWRGLSFLSINAPRYGRLRAVLFFAFLLILHWLEQWVAPKTSDVLGFDNGLIFALSAGVLPLIPLVILLPFDSPSKDADATPPA